MPETTLMLETSDGPMACYEAAPEGEASAAVVVIQEAFGVTDHIEDVARRFAARGYFALAPHIFHRTGGPRLPYDDFSKTAPHMQALTDEGQLEDVDAALAYLRPRFHDAHIGVVGFCMGGRTSFLAATNRTLGAAVGFYGGGIVTARTPNMPSLVQKVAALRTPWLGLFGDQDQSIPVEDVETLRKALKDAPVETEVVRYPDAGHGFHCDARPSYHEDSAKDGWRRTLDWLSRHLV
ncbi:MAG: dienelactone hydrolase family protein [Acidimicrobiales bacterium]